MSHGDGNDHEGTVSPDAEAADGVSGSDSRVGRQASDDENLVEDHSTETGEGDPSGAGEIERSPDKEDGPESKYLEVIQTAVAAAIQVERSESYSGLLPHPEHWGEFDPATRERILRMSEAYTADESARRDRLVDAEIKEAPKGRQAAVGITYACLIGAALSIFVFESVVGGAIFLTVPVASIVRDLIRGRSSRSE